MSNVGFSATRRLILQGAGAVALVGLGNPLFGLTSALAANDKYPEEAFKAKSEADAIKALYGKTAEPSDKVKMDAPEIAENGAVVPISVTTTLAWPGRPREILSGVTSSMLGAMESRVTRTDAEPGRDV